MMTEYTFATETPIELSIRTRSSDVSVVASERGDTVVELVPTAGDRKSAEAIERVRVKHEKNRVIVDGSKVGNDFFGGGGSFSVRVQVPLRSDADIATGSGSIVLDGELGGVDVKAGTGDTEIQQAASTNVKVGSGNVRIGESGHANIKCGTGGIEIGTARDGLKAMCGTGDVLVRRAVGGDFVVKTGSGNIQCALPEGVAAKLDLKSGIGSIDNQLTGSAERPEADTYVSISAKSGSGDIVVSRAS
jgi:hypothetical protein